MSDRSNLINRLLGECDFRAAYIRSKLDVLIPSQIRSLRLTDELTQPELANVAGMKQSRISAMETPGKVNFNLETLVRTAAAFGVGLSVRFVPFSEMLEWENNFSQDRFGVTRLSEDREFLKPPAVVTTTTQRMRRSRRRRLYWVPAVPRATYNQPGAAEYVQAQLPFEPPTGERKLENIISINTASGYVPTPRPSSSVGAIMIMGGMQAYGR